MNGDEKLSLLVQRLYDVHLTLEFLAKSSVQPELFNRGVEARDKLAHEVLAAAAGPLSRLLNRQVPVEELRQLGASEALSLLTPGLMQQQDEALAALRRTFGDQFSRSTASEGETSPDTVQPRRRNLLVSIALGIGISVLAATAAAPIAALAVQEPITRELVKAAITGVVSGTVAEVAGLARPKPADHRLSDLTEKLKAPYQPPPPGPARSRGVRGPYPYDQGTWRDPKAGRADLNPEDPDTRGPRIHGP